MKKFTLEIENDIEYVVIYLQLDEISNWKKFVKENYHFLKKPNFKFIVDTSFQHIFYTKKYEYHNLKGYALKGDFMKENFFINGIKYETEEEYINELRRITLNEILKCI